MSTRSWQDWSCTVRVVLGRDDDGPGDTVTDEAVVLVRDLMARVEHAVSRFREDSELERVNAAAPRIVPVSRLTLTLLETALEVARRTDGAVDPTVGQHVVRWGYDADIDRVRSRGASEGPGVRPGGRAADWRRVVVDHDIGRVGVPRGVRLDLGATAKAWTADRAARLVSARSGLPALVEIGGDVAVAGPVRDPWVVRAAETADGPGDLVGLTHGGLATSATGARRWRTVVGDAHHVIDPRTGAPTSGAIRAATVWGRCCVVANAFSTAALVWGDAAPARLQLAGAPARLVDRSGRVRTIGAWPHREVAA